MGFFGPPNIEKMKAKHDVEGLIKALEYKDKDIRVNAVKALGAIQDKEAIDPLVKMLNDKDIGRYAARALRDMAASYTELFYANTYIYEDASCNEAVALLGKIGEPAVEPTIKVFKSSYAVSTSYAYKALKKIGKPAIKPLIKALVDKGRDEDIRRGAANALGKIGDARAAEPLVKALKDESHLVRREVAWALGEIEDTRALDSLIKALNDEDVNVRGDAKEALEKIKAKEN